MKIYLDEGKCTGCGSCQLACPKGPRVYSMKEHGGRIVSVVLDAGYCLGCRLCVTVCEADAITLEN